MDLARSMAGDSFVGIGLAETASSGSMYSEYGSSNEAGYSNREIASSDSEPMGFLPRFLAAMIDLFIVIVGLSAVDSLPLLWALDLSSNFNLLWFAYHLVFWTWRSTTLGGVVLNLKIERLNGDRLNFGVALIRALGSALSFVCLGIGFFWASWDEERQSWHDKIAGMVLVKVPKGQSLI